MATSMKRLTLSLPNDIAEELDALKKTEFYSVPQSKALHHLLRLGIQKKRETREMSEPAVR